MKRHTKIYLDHFGYGIEDFIPCECCNSRAVDIHHIEARGMGGDPQGNKDDIINLQALCRPCHIQYGDVPIYKQMLKDIHEKKLKKFAQENV